MSLKDYSPRSLRLELRKMNKDDFYNFLGNLVPLKQVDYTTYPNAYENLNMILKKISNDEQIRGDIFNCTPLSRNQLPKLNCFTPKILEKKKKLFKIGAESANGIVFLVVVGKFKFILKTALLYDSDPLDYEFQIQEKLNPIRKYIPNYSLGYFYFHCNLSSNLKLREVILTESVFAVTTSFKKLVSQINDEDSSDSDMDEDIEEYRDNKIMRVSPNHLKSYNHLAKFVGSELLRVKGSVTKHINLYNKLMNTTFNITEVCSKPVEIRPTKSVRIGKQYKEKSFIKLSSPNLFIATELTDVKEDLDSFTEKIQKLTRTDDDAVNIIIQLLCALQVGADRYNFTHYDLHAMNVLLTELPKPVIYIYYFERNNKMQYIPIYSKYLVTFIDFGRSYVKNKGNVYFKKFEPKYSDKEYRYGYEDNDSDENDPDERTWSKETNVTTNKFSACYDMVRILLYILDNVKPKKKVAPKLLSIIKVLYKDVKPYLNKEKSGFRYPYTKGSKFKTNLDLVNWIYKEPGMMGNIPYIPDEIYLFNTPNMNGKININKNDFERIVRRSKKNVLGSPVSIPLSIFSKGGKKRRRTINKNKKPTQRGGYEADLDDFLNEVKHIKKVRTKYDKKYYKSGEKVFNKLVSISQNNFKTAGKKGKRKRKKKQKGGINLNHDAHQSLDRIQQI